MDSIIGKTILGYKVIDKIGTGGFGEVYRVEKNHAIGTVTRALKVITLPNKNQYMELLNSMGGDYEKANEYFEKELDRVVDEIRFFSMISGKDNRHIVSYYESDVKKSDNYQYHIYILMEMLEPLNDWLHRNNMTVQQGLDIAMAIASALKICHENDIMHRDIKLSNIFVSEDGTFKLGDFGISKRIDTLTRSHTVKGTPHYMAPEIYIGNEKYNRYTDIYSLGILMYYLFNKRRYPFYPDYPAKYTKEDEEKAFYRRMQYEELHAPICATKEIDAIIRKALEKPEKRYAKIEGLIEDLEKVQELLPAEELQKQIGFEPDIGNAKKGILGELSRNTVRSISFEEDSLHMNRERRKKSRKFVAAAVILLFCVIGLGSWFWLHRGTAKESMGRVDESVYSKANLTTSSAQSRASVSDMDATGENKTASDVNAVGESEDTTSEQSNENIVKVKNYKNKKYSKIKKGLEKAGLKVQQKKKYSGTVSKGKVISQNIAAGTEVVKGTTIVLTVSKGEKPAPSINETTTPSVQIQQMTKSISSNATTKNPQTTKPQEKTTKATSDEPYGFGEIIE